MCFNVQGVGLVWESYKLDPYVQRLAECVFHFHEKVDDLLAIEEQIDVDVRSLETCAYSANTFADILSKIQKMVDDLSLRQYSNLQQWVTKLDEEVEKRLASRLQAGIQAWTQALEGRKEADVDYTMVYNIKIKRIRLKIDYILNEKSRIPMRLQRLQ
jgi:dynein heavy chain 1